MPKPELIEDLVAANHILSDQGVVDGFGHVSARHATDPARFLLARSMAPGLVTADDIMEFDLDGAALDPRGHTLYVERFIHSEIYKAHPEVNARLQAEALRLGGGEVEFLNDEEAAKASQTNDAVLNRPWELWKRQALGGR